MRSVTLLLGLLAMSCDTSQTEPQPECEVGSERCACTKGGACDPGLVCLSSVCVESPASSDFENATKPKRPEEEGTKSEPAAQAEEPINRAESDEADPIPAARSSRGPNLKLCAIRGSVQTDRAWDSEKVEKGLARTGLDALQPGAGALLPEGREVVLDLVLKVRFPGYSDCDAIRTFTARNSTTATWSARPENGCVVVPLSVAQRPIDIAFEDDNSGPNEMLSSALVGRIPEDAMQRGIWRLKLTGPAPGQVEFTVANTTESPTNPCRFKEWLAANRKCLRVSIKKYRKQCAAEIRY